MCGIKGGDGRLLLISAVVVAILLTCPGSCQNAEPGRRYHDFKNTDVTADFENQHDDFWDVPPEGEPLPRPKAEKEVAPASPRGSGNESSEALLPGASHEDESDEQSLQPPQQRSATNASTRQESFPTSRFSSYQPYRWKKKYRRGSKHYQQRQQQSWKNLISAERENVVNVGRRNRSKKPKLLQQQEQIETSVATANSKKPRSRAGRYREERRRRRKNRKRSRSRIRLESKKQHEEQKWRDRPIARLLKVLNKQKTDEDKFLIENPLNLSTTKLTEESVPETTKLFDASNTSYPSQLTTEPRIPKTPSPTAHYHAQQQQQPGEVEREFTRHLEREYARTRLAEKSSLNETDNDEDDELEDGGDEGAEIEAEEDEEEETEELPRFDDQRYSQASRPPGGAQFNPERMLGYSRTDEDLPILDMENEVLQRTLKDYNAYMSSSAAGTDKASRNKDEENSEHRRYGPNESSRSKVISTSSSPSPLDSNVFLASVEDEPRGDLSCMNGTFLPAPFVQHAVIKYVKSSRPGHEYLEADYECESGYTMLGASMNSGGGRLLCRERRWLGRLPVCVYWTDNQAMCTELNCEQLCKFVDGRPRCLCREGYRLEGRNCTDIDECLENEGRGPCQDTCRNLAGSFACSCEELPGHSLAPDNRTCQQQQQQEQQSSSSSACNYNNAGCSHTCLAILGRVFCLCPEGFFLQDDWKTCQDVDECEVPDLQTEVCRHGCINTPGSYRCAPPPPPPPPPQQHPLEETARRSAAECQTGYERGETRSCVDINECATNNGGCTEVCENTEGSYFCACEGDERILSEDKKTCVANTSLLSFRGLVSFLVAEKRFEAMDREAALGMRFRETSISCSALNPAGRGYLLCSDAEPSATPTTSSDGDTANDEDSDDKGDEALEEQQQQQQEEVERGPIRPGTKCRLKCPRGYELHGEYELTCRADGTWDGPKHGECLRYSKPRLDCPKDVVAELPPGHDEAFVTYEQPSTDLDWFRYVRSKPSWGTRLEANLKLGSHEITFYARHPVSKKQTSCTLKIAVQEGQAPKVKGCPSDIEVRGNNGSAITWVEPVFTDNVKVTRVTSSESPGNTFSLGGHKVEYEASDEAGWTTKCIFTVVLRPLLPE
ncbi:uncharacterized protein LOC100679483 isoform X1 [Nasonia vitripennis]|uniref:Uncharacterized protein n=1 Tax=Nasonia vitripennis TaxID=7425 RepID=A0A7M7T6T1_NASVI|nr:uncharacterized protein LOC100679483 isoform X1 [Nasonia vitripennis]